MIKKTSNKINEIMIRIAIRKKEGLKGSVEEAIWAIIIMAAIFVLKDPLVAFGNTIIQGVQLKATNFLSGI